MKNMKFAVAELVKVLTANRDNHRAIFLEAQDGFRAAMVKELERQLKEARNGGKIKRFAYLPEPSDQTKDYDRVLKMLEMCTEDQVELDEHEFAQYVMDDWQWKQQFLASNSVYSSTATALLADSNDD